MRQFNSIMAQHTTQVLEEAQVKLTDALVKNHLNRNGSITLEESAFYDRLTNRVLTEATYDFIPENVEVQTQQELQEMQQMQENMIYENQTMQQMQPMQQIQPIGLNANMIR